MTFQPSNAETLSLSCKQEPLPDDWQTRLLEALDTRRGVFLQCNVETAGRYQRRRLGFANPPIAITARARHLEILALNLRGEILLGYLTECLDSCPHLVPAGRAGTRSTYLIAEAPRHFPEEARTRQPSVLSAIRTIAGAFHDPQERRLGLYGAFGYDLALQMEPFPRMLSRPAGHRDMVLYLPDQIHVEDPGGGGSVLWSYDFAFRGRSTVGLDRMTAPTCEAPPDVAAGEELAPGEYAASVEKAKAAFRRGDLFEAVLSQAFRARCAEPPSVLFGRVAAANPAPYGGLLNLGEGEHLVSASPEIFVRVSDGKVETCPISGTIARGRDALEDARQIRRLLTSEKDEAELTMCTDVDRNDKARICMPGTVRVTARRQVEAHARLFHTLDQVEGRLRPDCDALDAFMSHAWAVTVTGAPKPGALRFIEETEKVTRGWYAGAIGRIGFDGSLDTGLTLRTLRLKGGVAEVRAGATLLIDSDPESEDAECRLKAAALLAAVRGEQAAGVREAVPASPDSCRKKRHIVLVDHEDSFVHMLGDYARQAGATVETLRAEPARMAIREGRGDLVLLSPGPGRPADFGLSETLGIALERNLPVFGICLGLQGIAEFFGGKLVRLDHPCHGRASLVRRVGGRLFHGLPAAFPAGRYHSLAASPEDLPACLEVTAEAEDGMIMALEHRGLPVAAVQFHPESILTTDGDVGRRLIEAVVMRLR
jgi:anthranilate synthase